MKTLRSTVNQTCRITAAAVLAAGLGLVLPAGATVTNLVCDPHDYTCQFTAGICNSSASTTDAIGYAGNNSTWCAILMFPLPTLPAGKVIGPQTSLALTLSSIGASTTFNGDVWGVANFRSDLPATTTPNSSFYYYLASDAGPGSNATPTDVKLVDNFLTPALIGQAGAVVSTPTGATNNLQIYIQNFYSNNPAYDASVAPAYVWLRVNLDGLSFSTANRYVINAGDTGVGVSLRPTLNLDIANLPTNAVSWNGNVSAVWDINTTANWRTNGVPGYTYADGDSVIFDDSLTANPAVTLNTTVSPSSVTVNGNTSYTLSGTGKITGAAPLLKLGSGKLILDTDNDFSGGTTLAGGTVQVGNGDTHGSIGTGPVTNVVSGTVLAFNRTDAISVSDITRSYYYNASVVVNSGTVSLGGANDNSGTLATVNSGGTLILAKTSSGTAHALGSSSTINPGGVMRLGGTGGDQIYSGVYVTNNGIFDLAGLSEGFNGLTGGGVVTNSTSTNSVLSLGDGGGSATYAGTIWDGAGTVAVVKTGSGTQTLAATNTYSGGTTVSAGTLAVVSGNSGGTYTVADSATLAVALAGANAFLSAGTLTLGNSKLTLQNLNSTTVAPVSVTNLVLNGTVTINIASTIAFVPGTSYPLIAYTNLTGSASFAVGTLPTGVSGTLDTSGSPIKFVVANVPVTWNGNLSGVWDIDTTANWKYKTFTGLTYPDGEAVTFDDTLSGTATINLTADVTPLSVLFTNNTHSYFLGGSGLISGPGLFTKSGTNVLVVDTDNDYYGGTVLLGGTLQIGNGDTHGTLGFGPFTNLTGGTSLVFDRTDAISVGNITRTTVDNSAHIYVNAGTVSLGGSGDNAGTIATVNAGGTLILAKESSAGIHALSSFSPFLLINPGGTMQLGGYGDDQIYTASGLTDNGVFDMAGYNEGFDMLNGSGVVTNSAGSSTLQLGENMGSSTFSGAIVDGAGTMALTKVGTGTLILTGTNTYTGDTTINTGAVMVATLSTGGGNYTVADGAGLGVSVATANGTLAVNTLTLGNSILAFQNLNSTTTAAITAASLNNPGAVTVIITNGTFAAGQDYPLIAYSGSPAGGTFALGPLPPGMAATLNTSASPIKLHVTTVVNPNPTNILAGVTNGVLTLQWPTDHIGWLLQSNSVDLANANAWFAVPGSVSTNAVNIQISPATPHVFYRMSH